MRRPVYIARTVAHGATAAQLAGLLLLFGISAAIIVPNTGFVGATLFAVLLVLGVFGSAVRRGSRLEWDGDRLYWREWPKRRLVAVRGDGWVVRIALGQAGIGARGRPATFLV